MLKEQSSTCVLSKVFEKVIRNHVLDIIYPLISTYQHGFMPGKSCLSNLLDAMKKVYDIQEGGANVDILYLDFMKAFDSVPHGKLVMKLRKYGIIGKTVNVI